MLSVAKRAEFNAARIVSRFTSADRITLLAKYMFLQELLNGLKISEVLDVGANVGQFAASLRAIGYAGEILSFEPVPHVFRKLSYNMAGDTHWHGENIALGDKEETRELNVMQSSLFSSFRAPLDSRGGENSVRMTCGVRVKTLEQFLGARSLDSTLLKVDTQGYEMQVFRGLGNKLASVRAVMCEISMSALYACTPPMHEVIKFLGDHGLKPAFFAPTGGRKSDLSAWEFDLICVR